MRIRLVFLFVCLFLIGISTAEVGVTDTTILIGMSNALSGPAKALGTGVKTGAMVYINKINQAGGIYGRKINVISLDDGYEPDRCIANTKQLINKDKVFALFGFVGTPTSKVAVPLAENANVPFIAPFTGAEFLRNPIKPYVFNVRASYYDETEALVKYLTDRKGLKRIAIFIQDDGYGEAGKSGVVKAMDKRGMKIVAEGRYKRNTVAVEQGLKKVAAANPDAVIMIGAYKPCAAFIKKAKAQGLDAIFCNISFVGTEALLEELGDASEGVIISQVVPIPSMTSEIIVKQYQKDMKAAGYEDFAFTSLEGYIDAVVLVNGLKQAGADLTREALLQGLEKTNLSFGNMSLTMSATSHQAINKVFLTRIKNGYIFQVN